MTDPTTADMIAWCEQVDHDTQSAVNRGWVRLSIADLIALRAIAARLRQADADSPASGPQTGGDGA